MDSANFAVDFTNQVVSSELLIKFGDDYWTAFGEGSLIGGPNFAGSYDFVAFDDGTVNGGFGSFSGFFTDINATPLSVGLGYELTVDGADDIATGVVAFGSPNEAAIPPVGQINSAVSVGSESSVVSMDAGALIETSGSVRSLEGEFSSVQAPVAADSSVVNRNEGSDPISGFKWGRWEQGFANVQGGASFNLAAQNLHYVVETQPEPPTVFLPTTGTVEYTLAGNTDPTDNLGNVGVLGHAQFQANFDTSTISSSLDISVNSNVWNASGTGSLTSGARFQGSYGSVLINGSTGGTGSFAGSFTGTGPGRDPVGAGMVYMLQDGGASTFVHGAAVFGYPQTP